MISTIRKFVYKRGFRPQPGTILYSPTLSIETAFTEARVGTAFERGMEQGRQALILGGEGFRVQPSEESAVNMYEQMNYCVTCGAKLDVFIIDIKECPNGHGHVYPDNDSRGLPTIVFEPIGDLNG